MKSFLNSIIDNIKYWFMGIFLLTLFRLPESMFLSIPLLFIILLFYVKPIIKFLHKNKILK